MKYLFPSREVKNNLDALQVICKGSSTQFEGGIVYQGDNSGTETKG